jgi:putative transposase
MMDVGGARSAGIRCKYPRRSEVSKAGWRRLLVCSAPALSINERWARDFVHDTLSNGRSVRVLTVLDVYSRQGVALDAGVGLRG